jgi:hypothetical protein
MFISQNFIIIFIKKRSKVKAKIFCKYGKGHGQGFTNASMNRNHNFLLIKNIGIWHNPYQNQYD